MTYQFLLLRLWYPMPIDVSPGMETWLPCHHSSHSAFTIQLHAALFGLPSPPRQRKYLRSAFSTSLWSLKFLSHLSIFPATSFLVFCPARSQGTSLCRHLALLTSGTCCEGDVGKKGRACSLNPSPRVWSLWGSLVGVYDRPCPMLYLPWYLHLFLDKPAHVPCSLTTRSWRA